MFIVVSYQESLLYSDHFCYVTTVVRNLIAVADFYTVAAIALSRTIGILREREKLLNLKKTQYHSHILFRNVQRSVL